MVVKYSLLRAVMVEFPLDNAMTLASNNKLDEARAMTTNKAQALWRVRELTGVIFMV